MPWRSRKSSLFELLLFGAVIRISFLNKTDHKPEQIAANAKAFMAKLPKC